MSKKLKHEKDARDLLVSGVKQLSKAVKSTLGPAGRTVIIEKPFGAPIVTKDGVTVAKETILDNRFEELGARIAREAANQTNDTAGDGTTTATVLAESILNEGLLYVDRGINPIKLKMGMENAKNKIVQLIKDYACPVNGYEDIKKVATISANNDSSIGTIIADAFKQVGEDGVITTEDGQSLETTLAFAEGMEVEKGFISPYFVTDVVKGECVLDNPAIFIVAGKLNQMDQFMILAKVANDLERPMLVFADKFSEAVLKTAIYNKLKGNLQVAFIENPTFAPDRIDGLTDIATVCGATVIDATAGMKITEKDFKPEWVGKSKKAVITRYSTTIIDGNSDIEAIEKRAEFLQNKIDSCNSEYESENLKKRLAKLTGGVATINVGGATESEVNEKKMRIEDALFATKAATVEGTVPGGGKVFLNIYKQLVESKDYNDLGFRCVVDSLLDITKTIVENAGESGEVIVNRLLCDDENTIYDALEKKYVSAYDAGIIDPAQVCICALTTAVSVVSLLLTTNTIIIENIKEKQEHYGNVGLPPGNL